jgi:hypothetical protein
MKTSRGKARLTRNLLHVQRSCETMRYSHAPGFL